MFFGVDHPGKAERPRHRYDTLIIVAGAVVSGLFPLVIARAPRENQRSISLAPTVKPF